MWLLVSGIVIFLVPSVWAYSRAKHEMLQSGRVTIPTFIGIFIGYVGHAAITIASCWRGTWPLPIPQEVALTYGLPLSLVGATVYLVARLEFRSFRLTWGLDTSRLVTTGIYRFTRNPQTIGAVLLMTGIGLAARSGVSLLLVAVPVLAWVVWLPVEERALERRFGDAYTRYRGSVARFIGYPRRGPNRRTVA